VYVCVYKASSLFQFLRDKNDRNNKYHPSNIIKSLKSCYGLVLLCYYEFFKDNLIRKKLIFLIETD
jgi:hypothetical protein